MNSATIAIFTDNFYGIAAAIFFLISHAFVSSALFLLLGALYSRYHTRTSRYFRGLVLLLPVFVSLLLLFTLANIAVPASAPYFSELLTAIAALLTNPFLAITTSSAILLVPSYAFLY